MNKFLIAFDGARFDGDMQKKFELMLTNHRLLKGWSSPFRGLYFVKSEATSAEAISDTIDEFFNKRGLFVSKVINSATNRNGRMASEIWAFLKDNDAQTH